MTRSFDSWRLVLGAALLSTVGFAGCAQDVGDVDRTQPDKVEKALFQNDDEWYFRQTVTDTDFQGSSGNAYMFEALESNLKRVRWVVTEDMLYAMSSVQPAQNLTDGIDDDESRRLGVVAAFPIIHHFDVQRSYSTSTGEQTNVIAENGSDRPWYEREYMRVDWSRNVADGVGLFSSFAGSYSAKSREIPQEEARYDADRTRISEDYIDTTTEYFFEPDLYSCFNAFGFDSIFNCEAGPVSIRNSFLKIESEGTYEPLEYLDEVHLEDENGEELKVMTFAGPNRDFYETECDQDLLEEDALQWGYNPVDSCEPAKFDMFGRFGYFRTQRVEYDARRGSFYEDQRNYYANRWHIWQSDYEEDGSLIPLPDRAPKPIVYHTNAGFPEDMWDATQRVADSWNETFVESVRLAKGLATTEEAEAAIADANDGNPRMFSILRNDCSPKGLAAFAETGGAADIIGGMSEADFAGKSKDGLERLCAEVEYVTEGTDNPFEWQRVGDLRYSFFNWVDESVPWLGYGPSAADPLTGQIISGNANFAGQVLRRYGAVAADYLMYFDGRIPEEELIWGDHVRGYFKDNVATGASVAEGELSPEERVALRKRLTPSNPDSIESPGISINDVPDFIRKHGVDAVRADTRRAVQTASLAQASDTRLAEFHERPEIKHMLMQNPNFRLMVEARAAATAGPEFTDADMHQAYISSRAPMLDADRYEKRNARFAELNMLSLEMMDSAMNQVVSYIGATDHFADAPRADIERFFMDNIFFSTQLHEVGHTVGLRHNFGASTDALNYHDEFWELRAALAEGRVDEEEKWSLSAERAEEVLGHPIDEAYASEAEYREASIMDYGAGLVSGFTGLGKYDKAAIHFAYANKVQVFEDDVELKPYFDTLLWLGDYKHIPNIVTGGVNTVAAGTVEQELEGINAVLNKRKWVDVDEAMLNRRQQIIANTQNYKNGAITPETIEFDRTVPYEYCDDTYRNSQLNCDVFDFGANQREILQYQFDSYRVFQPFRRYNRGQTNALYQNISSFQNWLVNILRSTQNPFRYYSIYQYYNLGSYTDDLREASILSLNFFGEVFAQPEPGQYCLFDTNQLIRDEDFDEYWFYDLNDTFIPVGWDRRAGSCAGAINVQRGEGNFYNWGFTSEYEYRIRRIGTFIDKYLALAMLFQISGNFAYSSFVTDQRASNVSFWTLFQDELYEYLRGIIIGDYSGFAGVYNPITGSYEPPKIVDPKSFGTGLQPDQANMDRVYTRAGFSEEFDAIIYSLIFNTTYLDRNVDLGQYMKVCVSNIECQDLPAGTVVKEFIHPETNQIYRAPIATSGRSITGDLIDQANVLKQRYLDQLAVLEATDAGTTAYEDQLEILTTRSEQLEDVVGKIDRIRYVYQALGASALY